MFNKYHSMSIMTIMFRICTILLFLRPVLTATPVGCDSYMNLVIALDSSESLLEADPRDQPFRNWNLLKNLTNDVISDLAVSAGRTRIGMMTFSDRSNREFDIGEYGDEANPLSAMHNRVHALQFRGGSTHTGDALLEASDMFRELDRATSEDDDRRKVMLVLTDGLSNDREDTREQANRLKEQWHTEIFTIGVSEYVDTMELKTMSSDEDNVIHVDRFDQLVFYRQQIIHKLCKLEGPAPPPTPAPYKCDSDVILDIAFLIDSSGSIEDSGAGNYDILKDFIIRLIDQLNIGPLYNQIGAIIFSEDSKLLFDLNDYDDSENIKQTIRNATFLGSHTNIASALRMANYEIFQPQFGDRENISNVIILITDGHSTRETNLTQIEADGLSDRDVTTFVMGITRNVNVTELEGIASKPVHEHLYQVENILDLDDFVAALIQHVCKTDIARRASLELYPTSPKKEAKNRK